MDIEARTENDFKNTIVSKVENMLSLIFRRIFEAEIGNVEFVEYIAVGIIKEIYSYHKDNDQAHFLTSDELFDHTGDVSYIVQKQEQLKIACQKPLKWIEDVVTNKPIIRPIVKDAKLSNNIKMLFRAVLDVHKESFQVESSSEYGESIINSKICYLFYNQISKAFDDPNKLKNSKAVKDMD